MAAEREPTSAQFYCKAGMTVGSHGPLTEEEVAKVKVLGDEMREKYGFLEPVRNHMDDPNTTWRFGKAPNYALANYYYYKGKYNNHKEGSLELIVENLVKTWEMEGSHKTNIADWKSIDHSGSLWSANGWKVYDKHGILEVGNYNWLMQGLEKSLWDSENTSWEEGHRMFHEAFPAFPWEVLEVFSGPPEVGFSWRHWAEYTGTYKGTKGKGQVVNLFGFGTAKVNDKLEFQEVKIFYDPATFLKVLEGKEHHSVLNTRSGCPFIEKNKGGCC